MISVTSTTIIPEILGAPKIHHPHSLGHNSQESIQTTLQSQQKLASAGEMKEIVTVNAQPFITELLDYERDTRVIRCFD